MGHPRVSTGLLIVIPAYNEADNLGGVLDQLLRVRSTLPFDVLVVDDASQDATAALAGRYGVACVSHRRNRGYGAALRTGYAYAARNGYRFVIQMDADGQHDACNVPALYSALTGPAGGSAPDIVLGSRFMRGSRCYHIGALRRLAILWFRLLILQATGTDITDPTTGLQGLNRRAFVHCLTSRAFSERHPDADYVTHMLLNRFRVAQVPAVMHERVSGQSMHAGLEPVLYLLRVTCAQRAVCQAHRRGQ